MDFTGDLWLGIEAESPSDAGFHRVQFLGDVQVDRPFLEVVTIDEISADLEHRGDVTEMLVGGAFLVELELVRITTSGVVMNPETPGMISTS